MASIRNAYVEPVLYSGIPGSLVRLDTPTGPIGGFIFLSPQGWSWIVSVTLVRRNIGGVSFSPVDALHELLSFISIGL